MEELLKNNLGLKVFTDTGWSEFEGLLKKGKEETLIVQTQTFVIRCTPDHKFFSKTFSTIEAKKLFPGYKIQTNKGLEKVVSVKLSKIESVYDLFEVKNNHRFFANNILVKNCEFLVFDETLISSIKLATLEGNEPIMKMGQTRWYKKIDTKMTYLIALDPSLGTGGDPAAIQVFEIPTFIQIAEWHHNLTSIQGQARVLRDICTFINNEFTAKNKQANIYYSVENNTVGEAALIAIDEVGEESIPGLFLSEPVKRGHVRRFRKGFNTTHTSKIAACSKLKHMVESDRIDLNSKSLISELKTYIAKGITFEGKSGSNDDLVSSLLLIIRMSMLLQDWDPKLYDKLREEADGEWLMPMPIYISSVM